MGPAIGVASDGPSRVPASGRWATLQQLVNLLCVGATSVAVARLASTDEFGMFSYGITAAGLLVTVGMAGLYGLAIREYHRSDGSHARLLTSSIVMVREFTVLTFALVLLIYTLLVGDGGLMPVVVIAVAIAAVRVIDAPELYYVARGQAKKPAIIKIVIALAFLAIKIVALVLGANAVTILSVQLAESLAATLLLMATFLRGTSGRRSAMRDAMHRARELAFASTPLLLSSLAQQITNRGPIFVVQAYLGTTAVAVLAASHRVVDVALALPMAYMTATLPSLLQASNAGQLTDRVQSSLNAACWAGIGCASLTIVAAPVAMPAIFGDPYVESARLLQIQALAFPFAFMSAVVSKWIIAVDRLWFSLGRHAAGAIVTTATSAAFLPTFGLLGAAWATVVGYATSTYLFAFIHPQSRPIALCMTRATVYPIVLIVRIVATRRLRGSDRHAN